VEKSHLTAELVESLQRAIQKHRPIENLIAGLRTTTLAGIIEYGCFRHHSGNLISPLPPAIRDGIIGQALLEIPTPLGLRSAGLCTNNLQTLALRSCEFLIVTTEHDVMSTEWENFLGRFERGAWIQGFNRKSAANLQSALHEMASNAVIHAFAPFGALVGYHLSDGIAEFSVADVGIGIRKSLQSVAKFQNLANDIDAIHTALRPGVTRFSTGGFGFNSLFKALAKQWGFLRFRSGGGCVSMHGLDVAVDRASYSFPPNLPGFQVSISCRIRGPSPGATDGL
jgi:hypothetical protein